MSVILARGKDEICMGLKAAIKGVWWRWNSGIQEWKTPSVQGPKGRAQLAGDLMSASTIERPADTCLFHPIFLRTVHSPSGPHNQKFRESSEKRQVPVTDCGHQREGEIICEF